MVLRLKKIRAREGRGTKENNFGPPPKKKIGGIQLEESPKWDFYWASTDSGVVVPSESAVQ